MFVIFVLLLVFVSPSLFNFKSHRPSNAAKIFSFTCLTCLQRFFYSYNIFSNSVNFWVFYLFIICQIIKSKMWIIMYKCTLPSLLVISTFSPRVCHRSMTGSQQWCGCLVCTFQSHTWQHLFRPHAGRMAGPWTGPLSTLKSPTGQMQTKSLKGHIKVGSNGISFFLIQLIYGLVR